MIAILPLRKNSQRLKNKNIKKINGKPLYKFILEKLLKLKYIDKVIITTDYKFKSFHKKLIIIERPKNLRNNCSMNLVIKDVLDKVNGDDFIQLHATSPLLKSKTIKEAIKYYRKYGFDSLFSVTKIQKRFWNNKNKPLNHKIKNSPTTQSLKVLYEENSGFYIFNRKTFLKRNNRIGVKPKLFEINKQEAFDIDDNDDFNIVKKMLSK
jgi:CMP-N-acetylneuraminic acid synthetase